MTRYHKRINLKTAKFLDLTSKEQLFDFLYTLVLNVSLKWIELLQIKTNRIISPKNELAIQYL